MNDVIYDRHNLYVEVWEDTMIEVAKRYGVSNAALAKTCKKLNIPRPPKGYWIQKEFGKEPPRPPLPEYKAPHKIKLKDKQLEKKIRENLLVPEAFVEAEELILRESNPGMEILVQENYSRLHPYMKNTKNRFLGRNKKRNSNEGDSITSPVKPVFDYSIYRGSLDRTINILQALCDV